MGQFLYMPPYLNWGLFGNVSSGASPGTDTDHDLDWLVDGRPGFPLRLEDIDGVLTVTHDAATVSLVAICHHLLSAGTTVTLGGDLAGVLTAPTIPRNGVPLNFYRVLTPVAGVDSVTLTFAAGANDVLVGEAIIGSTLVLDPPLKVDGSRFAEIQYVGSRGAALSGIPPYSERARSRTIGGSQYYDQAGLDAILEWYDSQDGYAYPIPSLIIPDSDIPTDARLVFLSPPTYSQVGPEGSDAQYLVELEFTEVPRTRW